ncbi:MAG TPA: translation elongation factor Ts [Candidatus Dormibacteraeota bacterium]|jgi:elongation factor Ts|nr:translation elongation factor Ts [Candidatus Dormibacteraeota bacterium]
MADVTTALIKELRDATNAGMMDAKRALEATDADIEKAKDWLRQKGITKAAERAGRSTAQGIVESYIHTNKQVGVLLEINSESDFVARNEIFQTLARELCLQIAGLAPLYVRREEVPSALVEREKAVGLAQLREQGKPEAMLEKIVTGKLNAFYAEICLLEQKWVKDDKRTVQSLIDEAVAQLKENIQVSRFVRFKVGESPVVDLTAGEE